MKKIFIVGALIFGAFVAQAQQAITLKFKYWPNYTYNIATKTAMDMQMSMTADSATTEKLKASGMKTPMLMKMDMETGAAIKTSAATAAKQVPFTISYNKMSSKVSVNGVETPTPPNNPLVGQSLTGLIDEAGKMRVDTSGGSGITAPDAVKSALAKMINQLSAQIKFPEKPMSIGDTFAQEVPMNIPVTGFNMDFVMKTVYKLTAIKDDMAYFDTQSEFDMSMQTKVQEHTVNGKGNGGGPGKMVFSVSKSYPESIHSDINMNFDVDMGPMKMAMKIKGISDINYVLEAN